MRLTLVFEFPSDANPVYRARCASDFAGVVGMGRALVGITLIDESGQQLIAVPRGTRLVTTETEFK